MDKKKSNNIWESQDRDLKIQTFINKMTVDIKDLPKTNRDNFTKKKLRAFLEEKTILDD